MPLSHHHYYPKTMPTSESITAGAGAGRRRPYPATNTAAAIVGALTIAYILISTSFQPNNSVRRKLQAADDGQPMLEISPAGGIPLEAKSSKQDRSQPPGDCRVLQGLPPTLNIAPVFAASYPGSGAKMSWNLISGLTGVQTGDDWLLNGVQWNQAVTVKTHFPHAEGNQELANMAQYGVLKQTFPRVMIILRHPMHAIPGYHNFLYEVEQGLTGHSTRAPVSVWNQWRDAHFQEEMDRWIQHAAYWADNYGSPEGGRSPDGAVLERLVVTYEGLVSDKDGPANALALANFLDATEGVSAIKGPRLVKCIWEKVIKYKGQGPPQKGARDLESKRSGSSFRPYTLKQYDYMIESMEGLVASHPDDQQLRPILESYIGWAKLERVARDEAIAANKAAADANGAAAAVQ